MKEDLSEEARAEEVTSELEEATGFPKPFPIPEIPTLPVAPASGVYEYSKLSFPTKPITIPEPIPIRTPGSILPGPNGEAREAFPFPRLREELRLDIDGRYPQMVVSGTLRQTFSSTIHWIANLTASRPSTYTGNIWYKDGDVATFPYTNVLVQVTNGPFPSQRKVTVTFTGGGAAQRVRTYRYKSPYFHPVDFEFDCAEGEVPALSIDTCAHPNRPATLPCETLTTQKVFRRAGFRVTTSPGGPVPLTGAGPNTRWSDMEMHDAMQTYWSRFSPSTKWAMWVFFASLHEDGMSLGGVMFDDIGAQHRQGTAIFNDSFISNPPPGDPNPTAFVQRMLFWTACHEMGHAFNLAHSWQKALMFGGKGPWIPIANEPEARSFMNYPYNVAGGSTAFFADFDYRFSDQELLFLRHAPARFVQQGNALWFDHHGFEEADVLPEPTFQLVVRVNRDQPVFEFLEPVTAELKLTNVSAQPQIVDENVLALDEDITVVIQKDGRPARQLLPFAQYCKQPAKQALMPGESIYAPLVLSVGRNGWDLATPGKYTVQAALHVETGEDIVSNQLRVRVAPPRGYDEEYLAQDFFSDEVGRVLAFGGSQYFEQPNDTLREITDRLPDRKVAVHANLTLGNAVARDHKSLAEDPQDSAHPLGIKVRPAEPEKAKELLTAALTEQPEEAVESLGHIRFKEKVDLFSSWLAEQGARSEAYKQQDVLLETLSARVVKGRKVLDRVIEDVKANLKRYKGKK